MFYDIFYNLCKEKGVSPSKAAETNGFNRSTVIGWKKGATPNAETVEKFANYFNVSMDYLMTGEDKKQATKEDEDEKEIEKMTDDYLNGLFSSETNALMLNGEPASEEAVSFLRAAIRSNVEYAKKLNDEKNKNNK